MAGAGAFRRRVLGLTAYYAVVIVLVGPMFLARAGADTRPRVPVRISLNVAMRTHTTDIATFTTPFPLTVGVASDGSFTVPGSQLDLSLVDVPLASPLPALGPLTVRASAIGDFGGTVDSLGGVSLTGFLQLLWSMPRPTPHHATDPRMLDCPVGPFAIHLSTATVGGTQLKQISLQDPSLRSARLVDDNLDVHAVPDTTKQCAGFAGRLNTALGLPIVPTVATTTTTAPAVTTSTAAPATTTTTTVPDTTTTTTVPDTTTTVAPETTTTPTTVAVDPVTDPDPSTSTTVAAVDPVTDPGADTPTSAPVDADPTQAGPTPDAFGVSIDPTVLALEPIPSLVSTLTMAAVPPADPGTTPTTQTFVQAPHSAPTPRVHDRAAHAAVPADRHKPKRAKQAVDKNAKTRNASNEIVASRNQAAPPLYFSPAYFAKKAPSHKSIFSPGPLSNLGASIENHRTGLSILFVGLLALPLMMFGLGLVASDLGWRPWFMGGRRRRTSTIRIR